jgi:hypothetical protein
VREVHQDQKSDDSERALDMHGLIAVADGPRATVAAVTRNLTRTPREVPKNPGKHYIHPFIRRPSS